MCGRLHRSTWLPSVMLLTSLVLPGCSRYGEVSPRAYQISTSLYSICNLHDNARIAAVEAVIAESAKEREITASEERWLLDIVQKAKASEWKTAMQDARVMMMDQVDD